EEIDRSGLHGPLARQAKGLDALVVAVLIITMPVSRVGMASGMRSRRRMGMRMIFVMMLVRPLSSFCLVLLLLPRKERIGVQPACNIGQLFIRRIKPGTQQSISVELIAFRIEEWRRRIEPTQPCAEPRDRGIRGEIGFRQHAP